MYSFSARYLFFSINVQDSGNDGDICRCLQQSQGWRGAPQRWPCPGPACPLSHRAEGEPCQKLGLGKFKRHYNEPDRTDFYMTLISRSRNNLISSTLICLIFMISELVFGVLSHSLAMATTPCTSSHPCHRDKVF